MGEQIEQARAVRTLTEAIRDSSRRAYRRGVKERSACSRFVYDDIADWRTKTNTKAIWLDFISRTLVKRQKKRKNKDGSPLQTAFWDDLSQLFPIQRQAIINPETGETLEHERSDLVELGDFGLAEIEQHDVQLDANIKAANTERESWERAKSFVVPLLKRHTGWKWRDAVEHMRARGTLPDLLLTEGS